MWFDVYQEQFLTINCNKDMILSLLVISADFDRQYFSLSDNMLCPLGAPWDFILYRQVHYFKSPVLSCFTTFYHKYRIIAPQSIDLPVILEPISVKDLNGHFLPEYILWLPSMFCRH